VNLGHAAREVALDRQEWGGEPGQQPELERVALARLGQLVDQAERALQSAHGLAACVEPLRSLRRPQVPSDRLGGGSGGLVVCRDLAADRIQAPAVTALQRGGDAQVMAARLRRAQRTVRAVTDLAVAEVIRVWAVGPHEPATPKLV
jgi:hypothetical protein